MSGCKRKKSFRITYNIILLRKIVWLKLEEIQMNWNLMGTERAHKLQMFPLLQIDF